MILQCRAPLRSLLRHSLRTALLRELKYPRNRRRLPVTPASAAAAPQPQPAERRPYSGTHRCHRTALSSRFHCDASSSSAMNIITSFRVSLHCTRRPPLGEPPRLRQAHPDLRNKAAEQKLTFVRIPKSQRCPHCPAGVHKCAAAEVEGASSDMPESMSKRSEQKPCRKSASPWPTIHPSHLGPRSSEIRTAWCTSSVPRGPSSALYRTSSGRPRDMDVSETSAGFHKDSLCSRRCLGDVP